MSTLYVAKQIHTLAGGDGTATGVLVADGRVVAVGDATALRSAHRPADVVDLAEAVLTPGLVDGHAHPVSGLELTAGVDLSGALDLAEVRRRLEAGRRDLAPGGWLLAWGLNPVAFGGAEPSAAAVGAVLAGVPAYLAMYDAHSALASPAALALAGVTGPRAFSSSASVVCDADGVPTGYLLEDDAMSLVSDLVPVEDLDSLEARARAQLHAMAATGLTGLHAMDFRDPTQALMTRLEQAGDLPLRITFHDIVPPEDDGLDRTLALQGLGGRRWRVGGVKMFVDGTIDGGTAWLEYADTHGQGLEPLWRDLGAFREAVTRLHLAGVNVAVHAIGDRGVREVLETFADLRAAHGPLARHRIEHIETIPDDVVKLFGDGAASASMQPLHCTFFNNAERTDSWSQRLGDVRVDHGFRWRDIRDAGGVVALGSDWPVAPFDPRWTLADAQLRRHFDLSELAPMQPEQALTALQALEGYTTQVAYAAGQEATRGMIAPGFDADFTVFAGDPLTLPPEELGTVPVVATVVAGDVVPH